MARPPGIKETKPRNTVAKKIAAAAAEGGITPLEVMLTAMREDWKAAQEMMQGAPPTDPAEAEKQLARALAHRNAAIATADKAAPYIHARLSSTDATVKSDNVHRVVSEKPLTEAEWLAQHADPANDAEPLDDVDAV